MAEPLTTQSVETKLNEVVSGIDDFYLQQAMKNIKDLIWLKKDFINDMDKINQDDFENFAQNMKVIERYKTKISLVANLLNAGFKIENEFNSYWDSNFDEISKLKKFNFCFLIFLGCYIEKENPDKIFLINFVIEVEEENYAFIAHPMMRESTSHFVTQDETSQLSKEKQNALFFSYRALYNIFLLDNKFKNEPEGISTGFISLLSHIEPYCLVLTKERFNNFLYQKMLEDNKKIDDFMDMWFKAKENSEIAVDNWNFVCELMQDWEKVYRNIEMMRFMKLFINSFGLQQDIATVLLNLFDEFFLMSFVDLYNLDFSNIENCKNWLNEKIDNSELEDKENIKELFDNNIFHSKFSRFFKKAIEDEEFLSFVSKNDKNFQASKICFDKNYRLFNNSGITWGTKAKATRIKIGEDVRDDTTLVGNTSLVIGEVNRIVVIERMDKKPELNEEELSVMFLLSHRSWWWNRSLFLNLSKSDYEIIVFVLGQLPEDQKMVFVNLFYLYRNEFIGKNGKLVPDFFEKVQIITKRFIFSENQKKVFDLVPEENREEFKNNFMQHPEFRATVELLGKTITDTESFVKLYGTFIWAFNLVNSSIQLGLAMQFVIGKVMAQFLKSINENDREEINKKIDEIENFSSRPRIEYQTSEIQI